MKKNFRIISLFAVLTFTSISIFYGCSSNYSSDNAVPEMAYNMGGNLLYDYAENDMEYDRDFSLRVGELAEEAGNYYDGGIYETETERISSQLPAGRKIIRDASLSIEAESVEIAYNRLLAAMATLGGYESRRDMSGEDRYAYISATIKIPATGLDEFLTSAKSVGKVLYSYITSSDITDAYFDSQTRLTTLEKTLEKYYEFLDNATRIDDQLRISREIGDITYQIENLKGRIRQWDALVEYSTVEIYINSIPEPYVKPREISWNSLSFDDVKYLATSGLVSVTSVIVGIFQWLLIAAIALSPIIIPLGVIILIIVFRIKKKKKDNNSTDVPKYKNFD